MLETMSLSPHLGVMKRNKLKSISIINSTYLCLLKIKLLFSRNPDFKTMWFYVTMCNYVVEYFIKEYDI
jgi:hypothetical protein